MAITLDELLGRNTKAETMSDTSRFPSYDDYRNRRENAAPEYSRPSDSYNFEPRPYSQPVSAERIREYNATHPYEVPRASEFTARAENAPIFERPRTAERIRDSYAYPERRYEEDRERRGLYSFSAAESDRLHEEELMDKLSHTASRAQLPSYDNYEQEERMTARERAYTPYNDSEADKAKAPSEKKARLNTKGKVILAVYLALIVLVAVLIIVNAGSINDGKAVTPSSSIEYIETAADTFTSELFASNNFSDIQIDCMYEKGI